MAYRYMTSVDEFLHTVAEDIDVYDDYDERCAVAYCPPVYLTQKGRAKFDLALGLKVMWDDPDDYYPTAVVECHTHYEASAVASLFNSIAGYCTEDEWNEWFAYSEEEADR